MQMHKKLMMLLKNIQVSSCWHQQSL